MADTNWIHDEDSFNPMEIDDTEYEFTEEDAYMSDLICETVYTLEDASKIAADENSETITVSRDIAMQAVQLIKAYDALYILSLKDYQKEYD